MIRNPAVQNSGLLAWDGTAATPRSVNGHINFGFSFEATADIAADAIFEVESAPPSVADQCVPGVFTKVSAFADCETPAAGALSQFIIKAGTKKGSVCSGTIPCANNKFIRLSPKSGDTAKVIAVIILQGPK